MLSKDQIKKLSFLNEKIQKCQKCQNLFKNGMAVPYWTKSSKFIMIAEAPGKNEVKEEFRTPLIGMAGRLIFTELKKKNIKRKDFLILNTIQCRPVINGYNGKPSPEETENCKFWVSKYFQVFKPKLVFLLGGYALNYFFEDNLGITKENGTILTLDGVKFIPCLHPAYVLRNKKEILSFRKAIRVLKEEISGEH